MVHVKFHNIRRYKLSRIEKIEMSSESVEIK